MAKINYQIHSFNKGLISDLALARADIERLPFSAETFDNWVPRDLGSMMLRPGTAYIGATASNNQAKFIPFVFSSSDTALIEITNSLLRVWVSDALVTRQSVSSAISDGTFVDNTSTNANWTDSDTLLGVSSWESTYGSLQLSAGVSGRAVRRQQVTVAGGDQGVEHSLAVVVLTGVVTLKIGSTAGGEEYFNYSLGEGSHSLTFTPTGDFHIEFSTGNHAFARVASIAVESSGTMTIAAPWATADLNSIRYVQSGDVVYVACDGYTPYRIERRSGNSWSIVKYYPEDGPYRTVNLSNITFTPNAQLGVGTLTASESLFKSTNSDSLYRIRSKGRRVNITIISDIESYTPGIEVTGVNDARTFTIEVSISATATMRLQRSFFSETGPWEDVETYTSSVTKTFNDSPGSYENESIYYRIGVNSGDYTSGTAAAILTYERGYKDGHTRVISITSSTAVLAHIMADLGSVNASDEWAEGSWSALRGYPSAVTLTEGRLCWSGKNGVWLSASDDYENFDDLAEGDSATIFRSIGIGPVDTISWLLGTKRLLLGTSGNIFACRASSDDEPLTPTNFNIKSISSHGSANVQAIEYDNAAIFAQRGGGRLLLLNIGDGQEFEPVDLTALYPEIGSSPITHIAVQRQPDTRIHCVRTDGSVGILLFNKLENIVCWTTYSTDGTVEDIVVLPNAFEDSVYYIVNRTINGSTVRYLEKWALESECQGGTTNKQADSHIVYSGASTTTITGLTHLEGETVVVWGGGADLGTYTVTSGQITGVSTAVTDAIVGLGYTAQYKSTKLAHASNMGSALFQKKIIKHLGVLLKNTHYQGLQYGPDFTNLDNMPLMSKGAAIAADTVHSSFDEELFEFPGTWDSDSRLCLQAAAPRPCTVIGAVVGLESSDKH